MPLSDELLSNIKEAEGCRLAAYKDTEGFWTIGYGHLMDQTDPATPFLVITQQKAESLLIWDIEEAQKLAASLPEAADLSPPRFDALTELVFNIGLGTEQPPTHWHSFVNTRAAIADGNWKKAADGLLKSKWAKQVGPKRSTRIANLMLTGVY